MTTTVSTIRELDQRTTDGITVTMAWDTSTNEVFIQVVDIKASGGFTLLVPAGVSPLEVFHHPFAYANGHTLVESF